MSVSVNLVVFTSVKKASGGKNWSVPPAPFSPARQPPFLLPISCVYVYTHTQQGRTSRNPASLYPVVVVSAFFFLSPLLLCVRVCFTESGVTAERERQESYP